MTVTTERHPAGAAALGVVDLFTTTPCITVCIDGFGSRDHDNFRKAYDTLRPIAWALHHLVRADPAHRDHQLAPIEALWWADGSVTCWRLFVSEPAEAPVDIIEAVVRDLPASKNLPDARAIDVRMFDEGVVAQTLHVGGLDDISAPLAMLDDYADEHGLTITGPRHEIYLSHVRPNTCGPSCASRCVRSRANAARRCDSAGAG
jgi:hypothetical protein